MEKPKAILFDLGDTVIEHTSSTPIEGTRKILEVCDNPNNVDISEIQDFAKVLIKETFEKRDTSNVEINFKSFQRLLYEYFNITFKENIDEIEKIFCKHTYTGKPSEGIIDLFNFLDEHNIPYAALSNSSFSLNTLKFELEQYDLHPNFKFIISTCDYCLRKPHKIVFDLARKKFNLNAKDIWFIGDSLKYDVEGAIASGMVPIWYNKKNAPSNKDNFYIEIKHMNEVINLISNAK